MKRGPKRQSPEEKQAKGTYQSCRDKPQHIIIEYAPPVMPDYLPPEARAVWHEEFDRVVLAGICGLDSTFFGDYCCLSAHTRALWKSGQLPQAATLTELRRRAEILGIAGPPSRALTGTPADQGQGGFAALPEA